jgi:hypothetical protein
MSTQEHAKKSGGVIAAAVAIVIAGATAVGVAIAGTKKDTKKSPPAPSSGAWTRATTINPQDRVRFSLAQKDLATVARAMGVQPDAGGLEAILMSPEIATVFQATDKVLWKPGEGLPTDWPSDDPDPAGEYHGEFIYGGTVPLPVARFPLPALVWVQKTAAPRGQTSNLLDLAHASDVQYRGIPITRIPALSPVQGAIALFVWPQPPYPPVLNVVQDFTTDAVTQDVMRGLDTINAQGSGNQGGISFDLAHAKPYAGFLTIPIHANVTGDTPTTPVGYLAIWTVKSNAPPFNEFLQAVVAPLEGAAAGLAMAAVAKANQG